MCLRLGQCFWGSLECAGDVLLGMIDLFYYKLEESRETTMSMYSISRTKISKARHFRVKKL